MSAARARVIAAFSALHGAPPRLLARAPGRVNLLGGHVDYNQGLVLPAAIDRGLFAAASPLAPRRWEIVSLDLAQAGVVELDHLPPPVRQRPPSSGDWLDYARGVAWVLAADRRALPGMRVVIGGDLPIGAGVSSSAAFEVALLLLAGALAGEASDPLELAQRGRRVENDYLGVRSGVMDQFACLFGQAGCALLLDCRTLGHEVIAVPAAARALVLDSGVRRRLAASGFNVRRDECERAVAALRAGGFDIGSLRDVAGGEVERAAAVVGEPLSLRLRHVVAEIERVARGAACLRAGDLAGLGALLCASHLGSRDLYRVSIPELDLLQDEARRCAGCHGARLLGGGFGGCVLALVDEGAAAAIAHRVGERFASVFGERPRWFESGFADGAAIEG